MKYPREASSQNHLTTMMKLFIFAENETFEALKSIIDTQFRLNEVLALMPIDELKNTTTANYLIVTETEIKLPIQWSNESPPFLFENPLQFTQNNFLAIVYQRLNNYEKAYEFAETNAHLLADIDTINCLQHGVRQTIDTEFSSQNAHETYRHWHNVAVVTHYGDITQFVNLYQNKQFYQKALENAPNDEYRAFTAKHFASLLLDANELSECETLLNDSIQFAISEDAKFELNNLQYSVWLKKLAVPYDEELLKKIKETLWEVLTYYERQGNQVQVALLLIDAAHIANISDSFAEALGYISRAVKILDEENIPELLANANYRKGILLYTWAQNNNPQFFKPAMEAYQEALKVFSYDNAPEVFSEIQHHLGVIYSEIPDEAKKKGLWAAISVSSFNQALNFFTPQSYPYEYAMICNSYGNALTKFPTSAINDNYAKALEWYRKSLEIRNAQEYPFERALTINNFLEAAWYVSHQNEETQQALFEEMKKYANEISQLTDNQEIIADSESHLERLEALKKELEV